LFLRFFLYFYRIYKPMFMNYEQNRYTKCLNSYIEKNPDEWITGTEKMNHEERSYLKTLSDKAGETFDETLSKAAAVNRIDDLQQRVAK
jgi:hypothetical protein